MPELQTNQTTPAREAGGKNPQVEVVKAKCVDVKGNDAYYHYVCALLHGEYRYIEIYSGIYGDEWAALYKGDFYVEAADAYAGELDYDYDGVDERVAICRNGRVLVVAPSLTGHRVYTAASVDGNEREILLDWQLSPASEDFEQSVKDYYENYGEEITNLIIKLAKRCYREVA